MQATLPAVQQCLLQTVGNSGMIVCDELTGLMCMRQEKDIQGLIPLLNVAACYFSVKVAKAFHLCAGHLMKWLDSEIQNSETKSVCVSIVVCP